MDKDILIIDDDISILDGFKELLMQEGYRVEGALNEEEALRSLKQKPCRLVITDLILPETTGLDLAKKIKEISADTDVILITAYPTMESAIGSLRAGICDYLVKPVKKAEVIVIVFAEKCFARNPVNPKLAITIGTATHAINSDA